MLAAESTREQGKPGVISGEGGRRRHASDALFGLREPATLRSPAGEAVTCARYLAISVGIRCGLRKGCASTPA